MQNALFFRDNQGVTPVSWGFRVISVTLDENGPE
jgi:hypothetical protein